MLSTSNNGLIFRVESSYSQLRFSVILNFYSIKTCYYHNTATARQISKKDFIETEHRIFEQNMFLCFKTTEYHDHALNKMQFALLI